MPQFVGQPPRTLDCPAQWIGRRAATAWLDHPIQSFDQSDLGEAIRFAAGTMSSLLVAGERIGSVQFG